MAEMRAVWRKCEVVALISTDAVYSRHSLATRQNNEDFAWKSLREDASRLLCKEPNYFSSSCSAQTEQGVAQEHEFNSNGRLLSKRTSKGNEYVERISNQTQAVDSKENYSKRERNWTIDDFKLSEYYAGPNKTDDSFATAKNSQDYNYGMKSPCKETKANESKLKQPKSTKYSTSVTKVAKVGRNNSASTNNSVATKPNLLQTKQQSKEQNIYKNTGSDRVTSPISAESSDEQHQSQVKQAFVRYIETAATPVTPASVSQPERSHSSQPGDPEIPTLKSGSCIPRMRIKTKVQTTETGDEQSTAVETSHSQLHHETGFRSVENPQDERSSYPEHSRVELVPYENALESDLRDSGSILSSRLLELSTPSFAIKDRTANENDDEEDDEELEFQEIKACASLSHTSDLSNSEPKSLSNNSRYQEININEISADSCAVLRPPQGVGPCTHSGNKDVDPLENKRWRGKSQIVAPRTDATRCRQQIERFRLEAENHAKHEIHQNL